MRRFAFALVLASCADPAALEVRVTIEARELDDLELVVGKGDYDSSETFIDCTLPLNGEPSGTCGFEGGTGRWNDEGRLSFVLYGEPDAPLAIFVDGNRVGRSVTATAAEAALPPTEGERRVLDLTLFSRTAERSRCSVEIDAEGDKGNNAVAVYNALSSPAREIVVSSGRTLALLRTGADLGDECQAVIELSGIMLCSDAAAPAQWCEVRPGAMAVGPFRPDQGRTMVGAVCASGQLIAATSTGRCTEPRAVPVPFGGTADDVSTPAIVDFDGDGNFEVVFTVLDRSNDPVGPAPMHLAILHPEGYMPRGQILQLEPLAPMTASHPYAPLVHQVADTRLIVIAADQPSGFGVFRSGFQAADGVGGAPLARAPALITTTDLQGIVRVTTDVVELVTLDPRGTQVARSHPLVEPLTVDPSVPIAIGRTTEGGPISAVIVQDGRMQIYALEGDEPPTVQPLWSPGAVSDAQYSLLANVDGAAGAEILSFSPLSAKLEAATAAGVRLEGWPLDLTRQTGRTHVVVTDLEGPDPSFERLLRDLEIVTLSENVIEVITLGPGSYDFAGTPWPAPRRDPLNSLRYAGEVDPHQVTFRAVVR